MLKVVLFVFVVAIVLNLFEIKYFKKYKKNNIINTYTKKTFMTNYERYFYNIFKELERELNIIVHPQVNLATIIQKEGNSRYINELFRNIDFAIFDKDYNEIILVIEINDKTHSAKSRKRRDIRVARILESADIKLIKFYSKYPNKEDYVKNRIKDEILNFRENKMIKDREK